MTREQADREITEIEVWQEELRKEIDQLPQHHPERERKIDTLFHGHTRIEEINRELEGGEFSDPVDQKPLAEAVRQR